MPIVQLESGEKLKFDDSYTDDQIGEAVDEYISGQVEPAKSIQPQPQKQPSIFQKAAAIPRRTGFAAGLVGGLQEIGYGTMQTGAEIAQKLPIGERGKQIASGLSEDIGAIKTERRLNEEAANVGFSYKAGKFAPKLAATLGGIGKKALGSILAGSAIDEITTPKTQNDSGLTKRAVGVGIGTVGGLATLGLIKGTGKGGKALIHRFSNPQRAAIADLKESLASEGLTASQALKKMKDTGVDLVDILDERFSASQKASKYLRNKETIKNIADPSLKRLHLTAEKLQDEVSNMVANKKLDPLEAGEVLGRNAKKIIDNAIETRRLATSDLYKQGEKGVANLKQVIVDKLNPEESMALGLGKADKLTLKDLLESPLIKESIATARGKSKEFSKTLGGKIYGNIYSKTKPVYTTKSIPNNVLQEPSAIRDFYSFSPKINAIPREVRLGAAANRIGQEARTNVAMKTPPKYAVPDHSLKVLSATNKILNDRIGNVAMTGSNTEQAALKMVKSGVQKIIDNANPTLAKAATVWKEHSKVIDDLSKSTIGKIAKKFTDGKSDDLAKQALDVLRLEPHTISKIRMQNPEEFNNLVRSSISEKLDSVVSQKKNNFYKAIFGNNDGVAINAALDNPKAVKGLRKLATLLDQTAIRTKITEGSLEESVKKIRVPIGKLAALTASISHSADFLGRNPKAKDQFVRYMMTDEGKDLLKNLARTQNQEVIKRKVADWLIKATSIQAGNQITTEGSHQLPTRQ